MSEENIQHVDVQKAEQMLKCDLTRDELLQFGEDLANVQSDLNELEAQLTGIKNEFKAKTAAKEAEEARLGNLLRQKYEMRDVECEVTYDFDEAVVTIKRLDTEEVVQTRPMTDIELQRELKLFPEKSGAGGNESVDEKMVSEAVAIINSTKRPSTSTIQRRMGLGYTKAARIMDILEERGVIGPPNGTEPRKILIDLNEYKQPQPETDK